MLLEVHGMVLDGRSLQEVHYRRVRSVCGQDCVYLTTPIHTYYAVSNQGTDCSNQALLPVTKLNASCPKLKIKTPPTVFNT